MSLGFGKKRVFEGEDPNSDKVRKVWDPHLKSYRIDVLIVEQYYFANNFFYLIVLLFSKLAVCFLFLRLTRRKGHVIAIYGTVGLCGGWVLLSILLISIGSSWERAFSIQVSYYCFLCQLRPY